MNTQVERNPFAPQHDFEPLTLTETAANKAKTLIANSNKENGAIRVFVKSGGCSGYSYGMAIDDQNREGDNIYEDKNVKIVVDPRSLPLIQGSEIDYIDNLMGGGFSVNNPQATSACGCGSSFRTDNKAAPDSEGSVGCH